MPLSSFPEGMSPQPGISYSFESAEGDEIPGTIVSVTDEMATVDFNHPLSNQEIIFSVEIVDVNNAHANIG